METHIERWKPVAEWEWRYEVSSLGRVRNRQTGRILAHANRRGYSGIGLAGRGRFQSTLVHRLVAAAFIGPRPAFAEVNHKNGDKRDNRFENLEYVTHRENVHHAVEVLGKFKLTREAVDAIRARRLAGDGIRVIAGDFGVSTAHVSKLCRDLGVLPQWMRRRNLTQDPPKAE